jgi:hypothetical protein
VFSEGTKLDWMQRTRGWSARATGTERTKQDKTGSGVEVEGQWPYELVVTALHCAVLAGTCRWSRWAAANRSCGKASGNPSDYRGKVSGMCRGVVGGRGSQKGWSWLRTGKRATMVTSRSPTNTAGRRRTQNDATYLLVQIELRPVARVGKHVKSRRRREWRPRGSTAFGPWQTVFQQTAVSRLRTFCR